MTLMIVVPGKGCEDSPGLRFFQVGNSRSKRRAYFEDPLADGYRCI